MSGINPAALEKLQELTDTFLQAFRAAAAIKVADFADPRLGGAIAPAPDLAERRRRMELYTEYGRLCADILDVLSDGHHKAECLKALTNLDAHFNQQAAYWAQAAKSPFASHAEEKTRAAAYKSYADKTAEILKLL